MSLRTVTFIFAIGLVIWSISNRTDVKVSDTQADPSLIQRRVEDYGDNKKGNGRRPISHFGNSKNTKIHDRQDNAFSNSLNLQKKNLSAFKNVEEISLTLVEVSNSKKFSRELRIDEFQGTLDMRDGNIESIEISLPSNINLSASYSSLKGNIFKYYIGNQEYTASLKSAGRNSGTFLVHLDGGPLDQTKFTFRSSEIADIDIDLRDSIQLADSGISPHQDIPKSYTKEQNALRAKTKVTSDQREEMRNDSEASVEELEEYESEDEVEDGDEIYEADLEMETDQETI